MQPARPNPRPTRTGSEGHQLRALTAVFLARFFEGEATAGPTDLRQSFFWLTAALATPGIFLPLWMYFRWSGIVRAGGLQALHRATLFDKTLYVDLTIVAMGLLSAMVWQALLVDRRDGLVLGGMPVRGRTISAAKLTALGLYVALLSVGMHGPATLLYGLGFGSLESGTAVVRNMLALLLTGTAVNAFVFATVTGIQSAALALLGPRRLARVSPILQIACVGASMLALVWIPDSLAAVAQIPGGEPAAIAAAARMPMLWFVGLYEQIAGTYQQTAPLAWRAGTALAVAVAVLVATYHVASQRTLKAAVEGTGSARGRWARAAASRLTTLISRGSHVRACLQLLLATMSRVHQHRLILSLTIGVALAGVVPMAAGYLDALERATTYEAPLSSVAAPLLVMALLIGGLRVIVAMPSELPASWVFAAAASPMLAGRNAARGLLIAIGVVLPLGLVTPLWLWAWGPAKTAGHLLASGLGGLTLVEVSLWGFVGVPCAKALATSRADLQMRWPLYLLGLYLFTRTFASWQLMGLAQPRFWPMVFVPPVAFWWLARQGSRSAAHANGVSGDPHGMLALDLTIAGRR